MSSSGGIQATFLGERDTYNPSRPDGVQLVACSELDGDAGPVGTCRFTDVSGPQLRALVEVTVYEARTGEQVGEPITLQGGSTRCPFLAYSRDESTPPTVYTTPTEQQYVAALRPFVGG